MNIHTMCSMIVLVIFKSIRPYGLTVLDFGLARNVFNFTTSMILSRFLNISPVKDFPSEKKWYLLARAFVGQTCFFGFNYVSLLIPLSLQNIILQTSPFWTSILGYFINNDTVSKMEIGAMILCFFGVVMIAVNKQA